MNEDKHSQKPFDALNARSLAAKREYVRSLEQRKDSEALSLLVECLCDESWYLRELAEQSFLRLGATAAGELLPLLEQGLWFTRTSAAGILGRLGYGPAVPGLLRLTEDANRTVAEAARNALVQIGRQAGAVRIAHALHRLTPETRRKRLEELAARERELTQRVERLLDNEELMTVEDEDLLSDENPVVRASEEGFEWEVLTSPVPPAPPPAASPTAPAPSHEPPGPREDERGPSA